jgi:hypothetical protein
MGPDPGLFRHANDLWAHRMTYSSRFPIRTGGRPGRKFFGKITIRFSVGSDPLPSKSQFSISGFDFSAVLEREDEMAGFYIFA